VAKGLAAGTLAHVPGICDVGADVSDYDKFGGWQGLAFGGTGFFRVEKADRWWLVTPEGNAFLSLGVNHIHPDLLFQEYNREYWADQLGYREVPYSHKGFEASPAYGKWLAMVEEDLGKWGFNTIGGLSMINRCPTGIPYTMCVRFVDNCHWMKAEDISFPDAFSQDFANKCREIAKKQCAPRRDDPYLVGYFYSDTPILTCRGAHAKEGLLYYDNPREEVLTWPRAIAALPAGAPGKQTYVEFMRGRYHGRIRDFNAVYGTSLKSFRELLSGSLPSSPARHEQAHSDEKAFLKEILEKLYRVLSGALREHDPNHLILGDRYNGNTELPDAAMETMASYCDVLSIQYYGHFDEQKADLDMAYGKTGKPVVLCDSCFSTPSEEMPNPFGRWVENQKQRAVAYEGYARGIFSQDCVVGWHWCGYVDRWSASQGFRQHSGIKDAFGREYEVASAMARVNREVYAIAGGGGAHMRVGD